MKNFALFLVFLCCLACSAVRVSYDYNKSTDFSNYATYNYYPEMETGLNQLDAKRLLRAVDSVMQLRGILYSEEPDFLINIQSRAFRTPQNSSVGVGVGGTGRNVGGGVSIGIPVGGSGLEREIVFDLVDSQKDELFWQAVSESAFRENASPSVKEKQLQQLVAKVFAKYPPKTR